LIFVWGRNGTGKSTFVRKITDQLNERTLVLTYAGLPKIWHDVKGIDPANAKEMKSFKGYRQVVYIQYEEKTWEHIYNNFKNGVLILDDSKEYIPDSLQHLEFFKRLMSSYRHRMLDVFLIVHSSGGIPKGAWQNATHAFVGSTASAVRRNLPVVALDELIQAQKEINRLFSEAIKRNDNSQYGLFINVPL
jgi:Cdc6-like AAA superfamily ATPase